MNKSSEQNKNEVELIDYTFPQMKRYHWSILIIGCFVIGFLLYFPLGTKLHDLISSSITQIPGCQLSYNSLKIEFFLPKVIIEDLSIPAHCAKSSEDIFLKSATVYFNGPSFSPIGISTSLETQIGKDIIEINQSLGPTSQIFKIDDKKISFKSIKSLVPLPVDLSGDITIGAFIQLVKGQLDEASIKIKSQNLVIPSQTIQILLIPQLILNDFSLKAEQLNPKQIKIQELIIGDTSSPLRAKFDGIIYPNQNNFLASQIDLKGEFAISDKLLQSDNFSMLKFFLNQYNQRDGFYQIKLTGTIGLPRPSTL